MNDEYQTEVTHWFNELKAGNQGATDHLWQTYFEAIVGLARKRMGNAPRKMADEEDVAISVFRCLANGALAGRFANDMNRTELWKLLIVITRQKVADQVRRATAAKRGAGAVGGESAFLGQAGEFTRFGIEQVASETPSPELLVAMDEEYQRLFSLLRDDSLCKLAQLRLEGYSNEEIAEQLGISLRSVERKLKLIRDRWSDELAEPPT
jgi:RNA polymerase sigma factor (sigma-70 family)